MAKMDCIRAGYRAVIVGATGGIGSALYQSLEADENCSKCVGLGRSTWPATDLLDETSIQKASSLLSKDAPFHLIIDATGLLHDDEVMPEKTIDGVDPTAMARSFAVNATGPLLLLKHFRKLLPRDEPSVFATISARVGSISDNQLGGWYGYRASKAALNMFVKTASIEIARKRPQAICLALHPGTVRTELSKPFAGKRALLEPDEAAERLLSVVGQSTVGDNGSFFAHDGQRIPW
ncbi:MAG: SDR family NAD(P)-dependent oxidoreductase [Pseudomonadota bacterium]